MGRYLGSLEFYVDIAAVGIIVVGLTRATGLW